MERVLGVRPGLCDVEDDGAGGFSLLGRHGLYKEGPLRVVAFFDGVEEVDDVIVRVHACEAESVVGGEVGDAVRGLEVHFDVVEGAVRVRRVGVAELGIG